MPELKAAAEQLRATDNFYRDNIRKFEDATVRRIAAFHRAAAPADAEQLANLALHGEGGQINRERIRMIRQMGGEDLWRSVVAADGRAMLNEAGYQAGRVDPVKLAAQINQRVESGALREAYPAAEAERLRLQADRISRVFGKIPVQAREGDTVFSLMDRADAALRRAQDLAARDPMAVYKNEMAKLSTDTRAAMAAGKAEIAKTPQNEFVSMEAEAAANKIIETPSLLKSVAMQFGENSPEFVGLRQAAARRYMQDIADAIAPVAGRPSSNVGSIAEKYFGLTDEAQGLLFPGTTKEQMTRLMQEVCADVSARRNGTSGCSSPARVGSSTRRGRVCSQAACSRPRGASRSS